MDLDRLFEKPDQFLLGFEGDEAVFVEMDREAFLRSIFCDQRILAKNNNLTKIECSRLFEYLDRNHRQSSKLCYIFHMAHCGSTLLARALDIKNSNIVYREPLALRQLGVSAASNYYGGDIPSEWHQKMNLITSLLGRTYNNEGPIIIKGNVPVNFIIPQLLDNGPDVRALLLYFPLEYYLMAILRSPSHQKWVGSVLGELYKGISIVTGIKQQLTLPQGAACLWLAQISIYNEIISKYPLVRSLYAEDLFNEPMLVLKKTLNFFGQSCEDSELEDIVSGDLFTHYSKNSEHAFDNESRLARRASIKEEIADMVGEARDWVEQQINICPIPERLLNPLTGNSVDLLMRAQ